MLIGLPAFAVAIPLNYFLVHRLEMNKAGAYAIVLGMQITVNFFLCRYFVFQNREVRGLWRNFLVFLNGNLIFRLADWAVYVLLTKEFGLPYLGVQLFNVTVFALTKYEFARRVLGNERND